MWNWLSLNWTVKVQIAAAVMCKRSIIIPSFKMKGKLIASDSA